MKYKGFCEKVAEKFGHFNNFVTLSLCNPHYK